MIARLRAVEGGVETAREREVEPVELGASWPCLALI